MNKEDKNLLLKDLCMRLPYGVKVKVLINNYDPTSEEILTLNGYNGNGQYTFWLYDDIILPKYGCIGRGFNICEVKPYLRSMEDMTEKEKKDLLVTVVGNEGAKYFQVLSDGSIGHMNATLQDLNKFFMYWVNFNKDTVTLYLDWLNRNMFDYRGLIEKGLAIEVTKENNPYK